ncbi:Uncharacterized protein SCF082_LOCUS21467 [Durusdinium trenchii]|uniref:Uncharacterized protein n=1 Tax=Durusdinium trenchii TaxID=1381693 RepID=A0ABP0LB66_9DINO
MIARVHESKSSVYKPTGVQAPFDKDALANRLASQPCFALCMADYAWVLARQVTEQLRSCEEHPRAVVVVPSTNDYRHLARHLVKAADEVVEVGSSLGKCTEILSSRASTVLALDVSLEQLEISRARVPQATFAFLDLFEEAGRLFAMPIAHRCTACFLDIGGDRRCQQVLCGISLLQELPRVRLIAVKSEELYSCMAEWTGEDGLGDGFCLEDPLEFLQRGIKEDVAQSAKAQLKKQRRARRIQALAENRALAEAEPTEWFSKRAIQAAQPPHRLQRGLCLARIGDVEVGSCLFLHHEQQPLFLARAVALLFCSRTEAAELCAKCQLVIPVFWGQGGGEVMQQFLGSYQFLELLPADHEHHQDPNLQSFMDDLAGPLATSCCKCSWLRLTGAIRSIRVMGIGSKNLTDA